MLTLPLQVDLKERQRNHVDIEYLHLIVCFIIADLRKEYPNLLLDFQNTIHIDLKIGKLKDN